MFLIVVGTTDAAFFDTTIWVMHLQPLSICALIRILHNFLDAILNLSACLYSVSSTICPAKGMAKGTQNYW